MLKLNLGCGHVQPEGWENVDGSLRAWLATHISWMDKMLVRLRCCPPTEFNRNTRFANLLKRFPWPDESADFVYMGEVLEHFTREDGQRLLLNCYRVLRPGGIIRFRVPDNVRFWRNYVKEFDEAYARPPLEWTERHSRWVEMFFNDIYVRRRWLSSFGHYHKWMYDEISAIRALERAGFVSAKRRSFLDSAIPDVKVVETREDLTVEAIKPSVAARTNAEHRFQLQEK
jgi:predicted SAM-dependent methyltransferase